MKVTAPITFERQERSATEARAFLDAVNIKAAHPDCRLRDLTLEERAALGGMASVGSRSGYDRLCELRRREYADRVAEMQLTKGNPFTQWAEIMAHTFGPTVKVWHNELPWLEALAVARYGEEPEAWPVAFDGDDLRRAQKWMLRNDWPAGVERLIRPPNGFVRVGIALALAIACAVAAAAGWVDWRAALSLLVVGSALTNFWENELIDHMFRARSYTAPTDHYIALYTAAPGETGGGTEVTGGSYARVQVAAGFANWEGTGGETTNVDSAGTGGATQNRNAITFPAPTANWGSVTHFASLDAASSGNMYFYGSLTTPKTVNNGDPAPSFAAGALDFTLA